MKKIIKIILWLFVGLMLIVDVSLTLYLLHYNEYNVSVIGDTSLLIMNDKIDKFEKGDLVLVKKNPNSDYKVGDRVFFYDNSGKEIVVNYGKINEVDENPGLDSVFVMNDNYLLGYDNVIGNSETAVVYSGVGSLIGLLASRWVFLIVIILPITILFLFQLYLLLNEIKKAKK
ncbi:MAG: hypothetical protein PHC42_02410 [Bacilli bacterium]|nr:hypothetical protein [Bacilli bacterium]MDD4831616.1 hypothetical protein [Bacilli bacterium]